MPNKCLQEKIACRERLRCKVWLSLRVCSLLQYTPAWLWASIQRGCLHRPEPYLHWPSTRNMDLVSPNKSDCWHTRTLMIWTPETMARKYGWGKYYASLCNQFKFCFLGSCHLFIGTVTGKLLQLSPSVILKKSTQYNSVIRLWSFILGTNSAQCIYTMDLCI